METSSVNLADAEHWRALLDRLPRFRRDLYYTPEYYAANATWAPGEAICWAARDGDRLAVYPFFRRSVNELDLLPLDRPCFDIEGAYGYNGMAVNCDDPDFIAAVYAGFAAFCASENIIAEFTRFHPLLQNHRLAAGHMPTYYLHDTVIIDLSAGYDVVWTEGYDAKNRNMIRKALKSGVSCRESADWEGFRRQYEATMNHLQAHPEYYFPPEYYTQLRQGFGPSGSCRILEAVWEGTTVASLLLLLYDGFAHYHLSARNPEFSRLAAVNLLLDYAVRTAIEAGAQTMHLGGGMNQDDSLMRFKAGFSPRRGEFHIGLKVHNEPVYRAVCRAWEEKFPEKVEPYRHFLLKYRK